MPYRDEHEYEQRRQQIIDGALDVFAHKGFEKATNKDIAAAAGIGSPGLIYHYFKDKTDLFYEVVKQHVPILHLFDHPDEFTTLPPREALTLFARTFLQTLEHRSHIAMTKLFLSEVFRCPAVAQMVNEIGPGRSFALLTQALNRWMDAGLLRRMDASAATRCFIGPLIAYFIARELFTQPDAQTLSAETMATTHVDIFLQGLQVAQDDTRPE
jgi:AcrR family transcriptional regulator